MGTMRAPGPAGPETESAAGDPASGRSPKRLRENYLQTELHLVATVAPSRT
jgi:hypothetical protein